MDIGSRFPAHCTALGRVLLAYRDAAEMDSFLLKAEREGLQQYTNGTLTDMGLLKQELRKIREQGYAIETEQYLPGIRCVAAPIFNHTGKAVAALSVAGPAVRLTDECVEDFVPALKKTTGNISVRLGYKR